MSEHLIDAIDDVLPQTQCRQCGYDGCRAYAWAIVMDHAPINRCAPGGQAGIKTLAEVTGQKELPLDPEYGHEVPLEVSEIETQNCIGCRKCVAVCPTGAIVGAKMVAAPFEWTRERAHAARDHYRNKLARERAIKAEREAKLSAQSAAEKKKALLADILSRVKK